MRLKYVFFLIIIDYSVWTWSLSSNHILVLNHINNGCWYNYTKQIIKNLKNRKFCSLNKLRIHNKYKFWIQLQSFGLFSFLLFLYSRNLLWNTIFLVALNAGSPLPITIIGKVNRYSNIFVLKILTIFNDSNLIFRILFF